MESKLNSIYLLSSKLLDVYCVQCSVFIWKWNRILVCWGFVPVYVWVYAWKILTNTEHRTLYLLRWNWLPSCKSSVCSLFTFISQTHWMPTVNCWMGFNLRKFVCFIYCQLIKLSMVEFNSIARQNSCFSYKFCWNWKKKKRKFTVRRLWQTIYFLISRTGFHFGLKNYLSLLLFHCWVNFTSSVWIKTLQLNKTLNSCLSHGASIVVAFLPIEFSTFQIQFSANPIKMQSSWNFIFE